MDKKIQEDLHIGSFRKISSRLEQIVGRIREVCDENFEVNEVDGIDGSRVQASAYSKDNKNYVFLTYDLIEILDDDELACVISHEVAHLEHKDIYREKKTLDENVKKVTKGVIKLDNALKEEGYGWIKRGLFGIGSVLVGTAGVYLMSREASRKHETEADLKALEIAEQAGYNPNAYGSALKKISGGYLHEQGFLESITSTHPETKERIEKSRK